MRHNQRMVTADVVGRIPSAVLGLQQAMQLAGACVGAHCQEQQLCFREVVCQCLIYASVRFLLATSPTSSFAVHRCYAACLVAADIVYV